MLMITYERFESWYLDKVRCPLEHPAVNGEVERMAMIGQAQAEPMLNLRDPRSWLERKPPYHVRVEAGHTTYQVNWLVWC